MPPHTPRVPPIPLPGPRNTIRCQPIFYESRPLPEHRQSPQLPLSPYVNRHRKFARARHRQRRVPHRERRAPTKTVPEHDTETPRTVCVGARRSLSRPGALCVEPRRFLCRSPALSVSRPGALALCVGARRSPPDTRGALSVSGPGIVCVGARRSLSRPGALGVEPRLFISVSVFGALCVGPRHRERWALIQRAPGPDTESAVPRHRERRAPTQRAPGSGASSMKAGHPASPSSMKADPCQSTVKAHSCP